MRRAAGIQKKISLSSPILASGAVSVIIQSVMVRELLFFYNGAEFILGFILFFWMLLTAGGAALGTIIKKSLPLRRMTAIAVMLPSLASLAGLWCLYFFEPMVFEKGVMASPLTLPLTAFVMLFLPCLSGGVLFTLWGQMAQHAAYSKGAAYTREAAGSVAGGLLFYFLSVSGFSSPLIIAFALLLSSVSLLLFSGKVAGRIFSVVMIMLSCVFLVVVINNAGVWQNWYGKLYPGQLVTGFVETPYGVVAVTKAGNQQNYYLNRTLLYSDHDVVTDEESVHFALFQRKNPGSVLMISGGISGRPEEVMKYHPDVFDYADINPVMLQWSEEYFRQHHLENIRLVEKDARLWLGVSDVKYDAILINLPEPSTLVLNRFFTIGFFRNASQCLTDSGLVCISLPGNSNSPGKEEKQMAAVMLRTLNAVFSDVIIIPGEKFYFLASRRPLSSQIAALSRGRTIAARYVNEDYFNDEMRRMITDRVNALRDDDAAVNTDMHPVLAISGQQYLLNIFGMKGFHITWIVIPLLFVLLLVLRPGYSLVFTSGLTSTAAELSLIFIFQTLTGHVYSSYALLLATFMAGMFLGAATARHARWRSVFVAQLLMGSLCALVPLLIYLMQGHDSMLIPLIFVLLFFFAFITGRQFVVVPCGDTINSAGKTGLLYASDLAGASLAALFFASVAIPFFGLSGSFYALSALNLTALTAALIKSKWTRP